jgi:hypothetical protein
LLRVAPYCVPVGVREVSNDPNANTEAHLLPHFRLTYAESKMVADGTRTRDLRSHNPMRRFRHSSSLPENPINTPDS